MRIAVIALLSLAACSSNKSEPVPANPGSGSGSGSALPAPPASPPKDAAAAAPADAQVVAAGPYVCCCESTGDATHDSIEGDPTACTADDMRGSCVELKSCQLDAPPQLLAAGTPVTVEAGGLVAMWKTREAKAFGAVEIKPAGAHATVRTDGSDNDENPWKKHGRIPTAPGPLTITAQADGTALVSNGKTTWVLAQEYRYGAITFTKKKP